ncbi:MAG: ECF-type sigma factor [Planctomycetota bacterium]
MSEQSITHWIKRAQLEDSEGEEAIWNHYFEQVVRLARSRMTLIQTSIYDAEDAALSAIHSLFRGIRANRFPELNDRHNLWRLLIVITSRKISAQRRRQSSRIVNAGQKQSEFAILGCLSEEPTAEFVSEVMDETENALNLLGDDQLQKIAVLKLDGFTTKEISERVHATTRTVRRKLERIRDIWGIAEDA